ncbi:MAG: bifunctional UDP-N-acetylglucosamine diphosphorylase/glucosamine-1-phosphate N-acetyltransferase GlmU [Sneathiellaceae bacterium]
MTADSLASESLAADPLAVVILAAGRGTRMRSRLPKVLHPVGQRPLLDHVLEAAAGLDAARRVVVLGRGMDEVAALCARRGAETVVQDPPRGTGDAVRAAAALLAGHAGPVLVLYGDTPLLGPETLSGLLRARAPGGLSLLTFRPPEPGGYGRVLCDADGQVAAIVEARDASAEQLAVDLCNAGPLAAPGPGLFRLLAGLDDANAQGEVYLTDVVAGARAAGLTVHPFEAPADDLQGINTRADLAVAERIFQGRRREAAMAGGATLVDPATVWFAADTSLGRDVVIEPNVVFGPGVTVEDEVRIKAFCHIEGAHLSRGVTVGPFARLRPGAELAADAKVGNFVEVKAARIGRGAKVSHLTYVGDADVGADANLGAGTITCNYDGFAKHRTVIGAGAFIGSNSALVAPVRIGDGAMVAAGSTITGDVGEDALAIARGEQKNLSGAAARFRRSRAGSKTSKES